MEKNNVCVAIVTYNRKEYLIKLLNALSEQSYVINSIYILDNHSQDGTKDLLIMEDVIAHEISNNERSACTEYTGIWRGIKINYYYNDKNTGGSGGFEKVFQIASMNKHDYLWAMDDDVFPEKNCLEILIAQMDENHRVTVPSRTDNQYTDSVSISYNLTNPFVFSRKGRVKTIFSSEIKTDCIDTYSFPFEGPLFGMDIVRKVGYPDSKYFILYDDSDYARRCLSYTKIRYVTSACLHKQIIPSADAEFNWKGYYGYRNCFLYDMKYGKNIGVRKFRPFFIMLGVFIMNKYVRHNDLVADTVKAAYRDAADGRRGKTVEPGKLEEYLKNRV